MIRCSYSMSLCLSHKHTQTHPCYNWLFTIWKVLIFLQTRTFIFNFKTALHLYINPVYSHFTRLRWYCDKLVHLPNFIIPVTQTHKVLWTYVTPHKTQCLCWTFQADSAGFRQPWMKQNNHLASRLKEFWLEVALLELRKVFLFALEKNSKLSQCTGRREFPCQLHKQDFEYSLGIWSTMLLQFWTCRSTVQ